MARGPRKADDEDDEEEVNVEEDQESEEEEEDPNTFQALLSGKYVSSALIFVPESC